MKAVLQDTLIWLRQRHVTAVVTLLILAGGIPSRFGIRVAVVCVPQASIDVVRRVGGSF